MLGAGTFAQVVKCRNVEDGRLFGVKVIKSKAAYYTQALAEVAILKYVSGTRWYMISCILTSTFSTHVAE